MDNQKDSQSDPLKIESLEELKELASKELERQGQSKHRIFVCMGTACQSCGSAEVLSALEKAGQAQIAGGELVVCAGGCQGNCAEAPLVSCQPQNTLYRHVKPEDASELVDPLREAPVARLLCDTDRPFFRQQTRVITEYRGLLDPLRAEEYFAVRGFEALLKAVTEMSPEEVIYQIRKAVCAAAAEPAIRPGSNGSRWRSFRSKYVVCNADEGDPGAFMNRSVLEGDPHRVLEGMAIAGRAVGARQGYVYARGESPLAIERLRTALEQANGRNPGRARFRERLPVPHRPAHRRRSLRLRRGDRAAGFDRGQARAAGAAAAVSAGARLVGLADADQQRRDIRQHSGHHRARRGLVRGNRRAGQSGHQGFRAGRARQAHRAGGSADRHASAHDSE